MNKTELAELSNPVPPAFRREIHPVISIPKVQVTINGKTVEQDLGPVVDFVSSDETLDRYDEVITAGGWKLDNYKKNPVVQNAHQYGDILFTIGKSTVTEVRGNQLYQRVEFATEINPMARIAHGLYKAKFLNAVSVGFIPLKWENGDKEKGYRRKYVEQELLEVSAVGIPANPNALQLGLKEGAIEKADIKELAELLKHLCKDPISADPKAHAGAPGLGIDGAQYRELHRDLRDILRAA